MPLFPLVLLLLNLPLDLKAGDGGLALVMKKKSTNPPKIGDPDLLPHPSPLLRLTLCLLYRFCLLRRFCLLSQLCLLRFKLYLVTQIIFTGTLIDTVLSVQQIMSIRKIVVLSYMRKEKTATGMQNALKRPLPTIEVKIKIQKDFSVLCIESRSNRGLFEE